MEFFWIYAVATLLLYGNSTQNNNSNSFCRATLQKKVNVKGYLSNGLFSDFVVWQPYLLLYGNPI